jgi:glycosyltransferase involved in cell wall biosynthesis
VRRALIATVRNEEARLPEFLASLERQTVRPDVIVVTDGGSTDRTADLLRGFAARTSLPFRWVVAPGNRSRGRNEAIRIADAQIIAVTDVSVLEPTWFERIVAPLEQATADVVAGWYELLVDTPRERAVGLLTQWSLDQIREETFLPSSRSIAFTRAAWERVGGYPEHLTTTEDTVFDFRLRDAGMRFVFRPDAVVRWRPAADIRGAYRMYRGFAESDARAHLFVRSPSRYPVVLSAYVFAAVFIFLGLTWPLAWVVAILGAIPYLGYRIRKVVRSRLWSQVPYAIAVAIALDAAMLFGYARGVAVRSRRNSTSANV